MMQRFTVSESWVRQAEHAILRLVSLVFSMASAYAIRLFFAPLDAADRGEVVITWAVAIGFGILGYIVSRGLVHRLMHKERIWAYAPICLLVELVDIACNYVLAASVVRQAWWLASVPTDQRGVLTFITYVVLSAIPLVSLFLAVVDMDLERSKKGASRAPAGRPAVGNTATSRPVVAPVARASAQQAQASQQVTSAAAKRASFWSNRQAQQPQQQAESGSARSLTEDPEKTAVVAGVP